MEEKTKAVCGNMGEHGVLLKAEKFVEQRYQPSDGKTEAVLQDLARDLGLGGRPTSMPKVVHCLSDVCATLQLAPSGLVSWSMADAFSNELYGRRIAGGVRDALVQAGWILSEQKAQEGLKAVLQFDLQKLPADLSFKRHQKGRDIEVRAPRIIRPGKKPLKGKRIPLKEFGDDIAPLADEMRTINTLLEANPLVAGDGTSWSHCTRKFNEGRLDRGGRLYGDWQNLNEEKRLKATIGGEDVCEIDIKACYLFLYSSLSNAPVFDEDPYARINFVANADEDQRKNMRGLAKWLINALFWRDTEMTRFPKGTAKKFGLKRKDKFRDYIGDIYRAFPALEQRGISGGELMFRESELIVKTLVQLAVLSRHIPAYPVHDCLLCRERDQAKVLMALQEQMEKQVGAVASMDVSFADGRVEIVPGFGFSSIQDEEEKELALETLEDEFEEVILPF